MTAVAAPGPRTGRVTIPASKSQAHRLLICAALGREPVELVCGGPSADILATANCLNALGADIQQTAPDRFSVRPVTAAPGTAAQLACGESGSTLRFLLPLVGALGAEGAFVMEGRLPQRPLAPFDAVLKEHGMALEQEGSLLRCGGRLRPGEYTLPGNVSSQYISGLLMALPRLTGDSTLTVTGPMESAGYVAMTEDALRLSGIRFTRDGQSWRIPGGQTCRLPGLCRVEGDWSNAAFFLCAGALSPGGHHRRGPVSHLLSGRPGSSGHPPRLRGAGGDVSGLRHRPQGRPAWGHHRRRPHPRSDPRPQCGGRGGGGDHLY